MYLRPAFFIIGERKCGTSSLYRYLVAHPQVLPCQLKEPQFFSWGAAYVDAHIDAYFRLFPPVAYAGDISYVWPELDAAGILYHEGVQVKRIPGQTYYTGEASANTFHEVDPALVHRHLPEMKLIVVLRDPVQRAFSHHRMYRRFRDEGRPLGVEITTFAADMDRELALLADGQHSELLSPGFYLHNLRRWLAYFPPEQLLVLITEDLEQDTARVMREVLAYLGFPPHDYGDLLQQRYNRAPSEQPDAATAARLRACYAPHNAELARFLGRALPWG